MPWPTTKSYSIPTSKTLAIEFIATLNAHVTYLRMIIWISIWIAIRTMDWYTWDEMQLQLLHALLSSIKESWSLESITVAQSYARAVGWVSVGGTVAGIKPPPFISRPLHFKTAHLRIIIPHVLFFSEKEWHGAPQSAPKHNLHDGQTWYFKSPFVFANQFRRPSLLCLGPIVNEELEHQCPTDMGCYGITCSRDSSNMYVHTYAVLLMSIIDWSRKLLARRGEGHEVPCMEYVN